MGALTVVTFPITSYDNPIDFRTKSVHPPLPHHVFPCR